MMRRMACVPVSRLSLMRLIFLITALVSIWLRRRPRRRGGISLLTVAVRCC